jgi:hypothetical protein
VRGPGLGPGFVVCFSCLAVCARVIAPPPAVAADVLLVPTLAVSGELNDNVSFQRIEPKTDVFTTLSPALRYQTATERASLKATAAADVVRYARESELDDERSRAEARLEHHASQRLTWGLGARFRKDSSLESELEQTGLRTTLADRYRYGPDADVSWELDPRSAVGTRYSFSRTLYDSRSQIDYDVHSASASFTRRLDDRLSTLEVRPEVVRVLSAVSRASEYALTVGWAPRFTDTLGGRAFAGGRYTATDFAAGPSRPGGDRQANRGLLFDLGVDRRGETSSAAAGYRRDLSYSSTGEPIAVDNLSLTLQRDLSVRSRAGLTAGYSRTRSIHESGDQDATYASVTSTVSYRWTEDYALSAAYSHERSVDNRASGDRLATRNHVWVTATFNFPQRW